MPVKSMLTAKQRLLHVFHSQNKALTVDELSFLAGISIPKIRNRLTTFEYDIVRVGHATYDLAERAYKGKTFRCTPTLQEITEGILRGNDDVALFLYPDYRYTDKVLLIDETGRKYLLSRHGTAKTTPFPYLAGISSWYKTIAFEVGDDLLFTCVDYPSRQFVMQRERKKERDEFAVTVKNKKLADIVYDIINHTISKYESDLFLFRKYVYVYPYNEPTPPDQLIIALATDKRFLISSRDKMLSWTGRLLDDWLTIGLKKYYFQDDQQQWTPVCIDEHKGRKFGYCSQCGERMYWIGGYVWKHPEFQGQYARKYIAANFFTFDNNKRMRN